MRLQWCRELPRIRNRFAGRPGFTALRGVLFLWALTASIAGSRQVKGQDEVAAALRDLAPAWYDSENDRVRWPEFSGSEAAASASREQVGILASPAPQNRRLRPQAGLFDWIPPVAAWGVLGLLLLGTTGWMIRHWRRFSEAVSGAVDLESHRRSENPSIRNLPYAVESGLGDLREAGIEAASRGDHRRAIVLLFSHTLVTLDRQSVLRLQKGRTNRQYLADLLQARPSAGVFRSLIRDFEAVFFGDCPAGEVEFARCLAASDRLLDETGGSRTAGGAAPS